MELLEVDHSAKDDTVANGLINLRKSNILCDVILVAEGIEIPAHRAVLAVGSNYFHRMFDSEFAEQIKRRIELQNVDPTALKLLVDFLYTYKIEITEDTVRDIFSAAHMFLIDELVDRCADYIASNLSPCNVLGVLQFGRFHDCKKVIESADRFVKLFFTDVVKTEEFLDAQPELVAELLSSDDLTIETEEQVLAALLSWVNFRKSIRLPLLRTWIFFVRLTLMSRGTLMGYLLSNDLLREDQDLYQSLMGIALSSRRIKGRSRKPDIVPTKMYVISGTTLIDTVKVLDFAENKWTCLKPTKSKKSRAQLVVCGDKLHAIGGIRGDSSKASRIFNFRTQEWTPGKPMRSRRANFAAVGDQDGIFVCGGTDNEVYLDTAEFFNAKRNAWQPLPRMSTSRAYHGAAVIANTFYVLGGYYSGQYLSSVEKLDEDGMAWTPVQFMNTSRSGPGVEVIDGRMYVVGGWSHGIFHSSCEVFDPVKKTWEYISPMLKPRRNPGTFVYNGQLFVIGGDQQKSTPHFSMEVYDPQFDRWRMLPYVLDRDGRYASAAVMPSIQ